MIALPAERIKALLLQAGVLDAATFDALALEADRKRQNVVDVLVSRGLVAREYFYTLLAQAVGAPLAELRNRGVDEALLRLLPQEVARQRRVIVFGQEPDGSFSVALEDPTNLETIDFLALRLKGSVRPYLATEDDLNKGYALYEERLTRDFRDLIETSIKESLHSKRTGDLREAAEDLPIVSIVDNLMAYAVSSRASDVHFEILDDAVMVRFRVDGVLREIIRMPKEVHAAVVARIKILSSLRVDEHRSPQDGRFRQKIGDETVDVRVSILPTFYGEKIELRILKGAQKPLSLAEIGMLEDTEAVTQQVIKKSYGMVLVCGPTGSGKTTTLYSIMNIINRPEVNIVTVEDPIEYDMRYVNQVQVNPAAGITFASGLRSILRQDPNIIMVGEIRDEDTANISVQAALTGHLVLSSLHTNDAPTAVPRLVDMRVPPFLVAAVINAVIAQRLTRRIHVQCIESYAPDANAVQSIRDQLARYGIDPQSVRIPKLFYRGAGCEVCSGSGYMGRLAIFEVLDVSETIRKLIIGSDFSLDVLRRAARNEGMVSMFEDGLHKVERGMTTIDEIFRVIRE